MASAMKNAQLLFQQLSQKGPYSWLSCPFPGCQHSTQDRTHLVEHFFNAHSEAFDPGSITSRPNHQDVVALMLTLAFVSEQPVSSPAQFSRIRTFFERWATVHILHSRSAGGFHCPICSDLISTVISPQKVTEHVITCVPWIAKRPAGEQENCALLACFIALSKAATATEDEVLSLLESPSDFSADDQVGDFKTGSGCLSRLIDVGRVVVSSIQVAVANIVTVIEALAIMATVEGKESAWLPCRDVVLVTPSTPRIGICMEDYTAKGWISLDHFPAGDNGAILTESLRAISRAVSLAHACSVALVDLTPQNIVRTPKGEWRLVVTPRVQILHGDETDVVNLRGGSSLSVVFVPIEDRRESQWRLASDIYVLGVAYALKVLGLSVESFTRNLAYGGVLTAKLRERSKVANTTDSALIAVLLRMIDSSHGLRPAASEIDGLLTNPFAHDQARIRDQGRPSRQPDRPYEEACCIQLGAFDQHDDASLPVDPVKLLIDAAQQVHAVSPIFVHLVRASEGFEAHCFPYRTLPIVRGRASAQAHRLSVTFDATGVVNRYADDAVQRGYSAQVVLKDITQHDVRLVPVKDFDDSAMLTQLRQLECHPNISRPVAIARPQELPNKPSTITDILDATLSYAVYYPDFVSLSGDYSCFDPDTAEAEVMRKDLRNALDFLHGRGYLFGQDITWKCIAESRHRDADQIPVRFILIAPVGGFIASWDQKHHSKERNQLDALLNGS